MTDTLIIPAPDGRAAKTRDSLLCATLTLLRERGYEGTSLETILKATGLTKGAFYFHFKCKEDCILAAIDLALAREWPAIEAALKTDDPHDPYAPVRALFGAFGGCSRTGCLFGNLAGEMAARSDRIRARLAGVFECWVGAVGFMVERLQRRGAVGAAQEPAALARLVIAQLQGAVLMTKLEPDPEALPRHAEALIRVFAATVN